MKLPAHLEVLWHDGTRVGYIVNKGTLYFAYDEKWLATGRNLSPLNLPFNASAFNGARGIDGLPGLLFDCLPDAFGRMVARRDFAERRLGEPGTMDLLAWRGRRGIGALQFRPAIEARGAVERGRMEDVALAALARGALKIARGEATEVLQQLHRGGTAGGAYPKALVLLHPDGSLSVGDPEPNLTPCLVKFAQPERKGMTQCEHAYAQLAALAGITPASTQLLADGENTHLLVRRFDITAQGGGRKHCHTASGLLHKQPGTLDYRDVFRAILRLGLPREDLREWARRTAFNLLASNADDHGKNHCFLYDAAAGWSLSPAYDMSFAESVLGRGMTIAGEVWPTLSRLTELFMSATLEKEECRMIIEKAIEAVAQWPRVAKTSSVPPEMIKHVQERLARIKQAVLPINV